MSIRFQSSSMRALAILLSLSLLSFAAASDFTFTTKKKKQEQQSDGYSFSAADRKLAPWSVSAGYYFLSWSDISFDNDGNLEDTSTHQGGEVSLGYRLPFEGGEVRASVRGAEYVYSTVPGNQGHVVLGTYEIDFLGRMQGFYGGVGVDFVSGNDSSLLYIPRGSGSTQAMLSETIGVDTSANTFIEVHYRASGNAAYTGTTISVGLRF